MQILKLLNDRVELALRTRRLKEQTTDEAREREVIQGILQYARKHPMNFLEPAFCEQLFLELMSESKKLQEQARPLIGFQGEHGAHGDNAARTYNPDFVSIPCLEFSDVFKGVERGHLDYGIVPVENSLEGVVTQVNDLLVETSLNIVGEINIPVHHCLLTLPETDHRSLRVVYSHPQALAQCREFLARNRLEPRPFYDTAGAAKMLSEQRPAAAAIIANRMCEMIYNLELIKENIEDHESNSTRFVVLSARTSQEPGNKCSIVFAAKHEPGSLYRVLKIFAEAGLDLTRIASRPMRKDMGLYSFFLDFRGSFQDEKVVAVLARVEDSTAMYNFLGCYPERDAG
jgi:prephenate dehydratase/chorismate mutase/prephenate dehydratase